MKFATKLTILFSVIFLAACAVTIYFVQTLNFEIVEGQIRGRLEDQASYTMDNIDRMLSERYGEIKALAADPVISSKTFTPKRLTEKLKEYLKAYEVYTSLSFFDLNRIKIADTTGSEIGKQHPATEYWKDVSEGKDLVIGISESEILEKPELYFGLIVKDEAGSPFGLVILRTPIDKLYSITRQAIDIRELKGHLKVDLVDRRGLILYSSYNRKGILKDITPEWEHVKEFLSLGKRIDSEKKDRSGKEEIYIYVQEQGYRDFKGTSWMLIVRVPTEVALASAIEFRNKVVVILSVIVVLALQRRL